MRALAALSLALLSGFAGAQSPADALRATAPTIKAEGLPDAYRAVSLGSGDALGGLGIYGFAFAAGGSGGGAEQERSGLLFSLTGVTFVDPDEFAQLLEGKRARIRGYALDFVSLMRDSMAKGGGSRDVPAPVFSETWIEAGRVQQWSPRPALSKAAILQAFSGPKGAVAKSQSLSNVKQIALGMIMYSADYDDRFPKADSTPKAKAAVMPYIKSEEVWKNPGGGGYLYNTALSGVAQTSLEDLSGTVLVWQESPFGDGSRAVGYTDGHAKTLSAEEWDHLWERELARRAKARAKRAIRASSAPARPAGSGRRP